MNKLLVIACVLSVAYADIGLKLRQQQQGYTYQVPQTSYGVPSYQVSGSGGSNAGYAGSSGFNYAQGSSSGVGQNTGYQGGYQSVGGSGGYQSGGSGGYQTGSGAGTGGQYYQVSNTASQPSYQSSGVSQSSYNQYQASSQYQSSAVNKYQESYNQVQQQAPQIFKHFYVHAAPEEPEVARPRQPIVAPAPQKHYKIIFIKTPSQPAYAPQYVPLPQQNEEKTIVYVLVKKPEEQQDIVIPKVEPKPPSKPEVYFIKYNSKQDSQAVINNIVSDYNSKGDSVNYASGGASSGSGDLSQYTQSSGSSQYAQGSGSGQYAQGGGSGQYAQGGSSGQYTQSGGSGLYSEAGGQYAQSSTGSFGNSGASQSFNVASSDSSSAGADYDSSSSAGISSNVIATSSNSNYDGGNVVSTSQGVPHETYGTPQFRA